MFVFHQARPPVKTAAMTLLILSSIWLYSQTIVGSIDKGFLVSNWYDTNTLTAKVSLVSDNQSHCFPELFTECKEWIVMTKSGSTYHRFENKTWCMVLQLENENQSVWMSLLLILSTWKEESLHMMTRLNNLYTTLCMNGIIDKSQLKLFQEWLIVSSACHSNQTAYDNALQSLRLLSLPVIVKPHPQLYGQLFSNSPRYNIGGGQSGLSYSEYLRESGSNASLAAWEQWSSMKNNSALAQRPSETIVKILVMTKDNWPLLRDWSYYHGDMVGFEHLYFFDGSRDLECIKFLKMLRHRFGSNVIFTETSLNDIPKDLNAVAQSIAAASDLIIKMDADEFLTLFTNNTSCLYDESSNGPTDCTLSPHGLQEYLRNHEKNLGPLINGQALNIEYVQRSIQDRVVCQSNRKYEIGEYRFEPVFDVAANRQASSPIKSVSSTVPTLRPFKALYDARTLDSVDLGGHFGFSLSPFSKSEFPTTSYFGTKLGVLHLHARCLEIEVENCRTVLVGHGYISEEDTITEQYNKLIQGLRRKNKLCSRQRFWRSVPSSHKALFYAKWLSNCSAASTSGFYPNDDDMSNVPKNTDFRNFLKHSLQKYNL